MRSLRLFSYTVLAVSAFAAATNVCASHTAQCLPTENTILGKHWAFASPTQQYGIRGDSTIVLLQTGWDRYGVGSLTADRPSYGWRGVVFRSIGTSIESHVFDVLMPHGIRWAYDPYQTNWFRAEAWQRDPALRYYLMPKSARDPARDRVDRPVW